MTERVRLPVRSANENDWQQVVLHLLAIAIKSCE